MKLSKDYKILPTSWKYENFAKNAKNNKTLATSGKYAKIVKFWQFHENKQKLWNFAYFMKLCKDNEILPT